jgi:hypothetical protein
MAKHMTGVVLNKNKAAVVVLINGGAKTNVPKAKICGEVGLGDEVTIFYDFTTMTVRHVTVGPLTEEGMPFVDETPEEALEQELLLSSTNWGMSPHVN